jgi:hypothetical protein
MRKRKEVIMDALDKEFQSRKAEIRKGMELLFKANMKITDWDVPEANDHKAAEKIAHLFQEVLDEIKADIAARNYDYY